MKHTLRLISLMVSLTFVAACSDSGSSAAQNPPSETTTTTATSAPSANSAIQAASAPSQTNYVQNYIVGIDVSYPPLTSRDEKGKPTGFEVELLEAIAADQKFGIQLINDSRANLFPNLDIGKYQILVGSFEVNPERQKKAELSAPYAKGFRAIVSKKSHSVQSAQELRNDPHGIAVQRSTNSEEKLMDLGIQPKTYASLFEAFTSMMKNETEHVVGDSIPLTHYLNNTKGVNPNDYDIAHFDAKAGESLLVYAISKGNTELLNKINTGLENIKKNGQYDKIYQKYFHNQDAKI